MARVVVKNGHQIDTCYNEIRLCAQIKDIIMGSILNTIARAILQKKEKLHFDHI